MYMMYVATSGEEFGLEADQTCESRADKHEAVALWYSVVVFCSTFDERSTTTPINGQAQQTLLTKKHRILLRENTINFITMYPGFAAGR